MWEIRGYLPFIMTVMLSWVINPITNYLTSSIELALVVNTPIDACLLFHVGKQSIPQIVCVLKTTRESTYGVLRGSFWNLQNDFGPFHLCSVNDTL
jgi:hypothetical protein